MELHRITEYVGRGAGKAELLPADDDMLSKYVIEPKPTDVNCSKFIPVRPNYSRA